MEIVGMYVGLVVGVPVGSEVGVPVGVADVDDDFIGDDVMGVTEGEPV
jgi:hypothetical protein